MKEKSLPPITFTQIKSLNVFIIYLKLINPIKNYAKMIAILFDYSRNETLENINNWLKEARQFVKNFDSIQCILIGNKIDLSEDRFQMKKKAEFFAKENNLRFFETSALTGEGIDELFMFISNYEY